MPQKGYIGNKKALQKIKKVEKAASEQSADESEEQQTNGTAALANDSFSLYVRGAAWIKDRDNAETRLKEIDSRIQAARHPRQKSADFCFIDFASAEDRDQAYEQLKDHAEITVKTVIKNVPKLLNKRKRKIDEKREAKKETRKLLMSIKKKEKSKENSTEKTNQLVITNLPPQATGADLREQYPDAVKVGTKLKNKMKKLHSAIVTFANPSAAFTASKKSIELHGQTLNVFLNTSTLFKKQTRTQKKNKNKRKSDTATENGQKKKQKAAEVTED